MILFDFMRSTTVSIVEAEGKIKVSNTLAGRKRASIQNSQKACHCLHLASYVGTRNALNARQVTLPPPIRSTLQDGVSSK